MAAANFSESVGDIGLFEQDIPSKVAEGVIRRIKERHIPDQADWVDLRVKRPKLHRLLSAITLKNSQGDTEITEHVSAALLDAVYALGDVDTTKRWEVMLSMTTSGPIDEIAALSQDFESTGDPDA